MKKRVLSAALWFYVTWYACNILGAFAGLALPGLLFGIAAGAFVLALPVVRGQAATPAPASVNSPQAVAAEG
jgi:hypothetical protein